jgi:putative nucleotidyltransferase with HDIG domain
MAIELTVEDQQLLADTFARTRRGMHAQERTAELLGAASFVAAALALWIINPPHSIDAVSALVCTGVLALAALVRFETPFGFTVPTQLAFVPLVFSMPVALVPMATLLALTLARLPDVFRGVVPAGRLLSCVGNARFALGPCIVFVAYGVAPARAGAAVLLAALAAQFIVDFVGESVSVGIGRGVSLTAQLRESAWVYAVDAALAGVGLMVARNIGSSPAAALTLVPLLGLLAVFARERHQRLENLVELHDAYRGTALVLGDVVEADDGYTGEHSKSVVGLALAVGEKLKLGAGQLRNLEFGALLHDVGKIAIPKEVINKRGQLDPHEWTVIRTHTLEGQKMLDRVGGFMSDVGRIVRSHHERWDGSGYPDGLAGEDIPLEARIIACCDTWNAMRTDRSYRKALPHSVALAELGKSAGTQLDPAIVGGLISIVAADDPEEPVTRQGVIARGPRLAAA